MKWYVNSFKETKHMSFQVKNDKLLLEQYDKILEPQVSNITEKLFDTQPVFKKIYLKS